MTMTSNAIRRSIAKLMMLMGCVTLVGCADDGTTGNLRLPDVAGPNTFWSLRMNHRAINLTTTGASNTVQLSATALTINGDTVPGVTATPTYVVRDTIALTVTPNGLLTAKRTIADRSAVIARLTINGITLEDTAYVRVFDQVPTVPPAHLSMQPLDSAKWSPTLFTKDLTPQITDQRGSPYQILDPFFTPLPLLVEYRSTNVLVATVTPFEGALTGVEPGKVVISAYSYAFGVSLSDTVTYRITLPTIQVVGIGQTVATPPAPFFGPDTVTIGAGGIVGWNNIEAGSTVTVAVVFDHPEAAHAVAPSLSFFFGSDSGSIAPIPPGTLFGFGRLFSTPGLYTYHDSTGHAHGVVRVVADSDP